MNRESETPQILKIAMSGVTELLRLFSPSSNQTRLEKHRDEFPASSVDDVLRIIQSDHHNAYFLTGRELYARNLKLLVPFFDCGSIILQKIDKIVRHVESWNISAAEAVLQSFSFKSKNSGG
ncbi:hypothetical protein JHK82_057205 [Glycine max]|nr:hypothetical protein JHK86_057028 [Glycine max]KAG5075860.1 hypothetical protein JHK84_057091 [Glycine max]KAG5078510.1 hypothetical protein JHK82_057205 [Glycine max]